MSEEFRPAHEVLVRKIAQRASNFDVAAKSEARAREAWVRLDEDCDTLNRSIIPIDKLGEVIGWLREVAVSVDTEPSELVHGVANELERRLEATPTKA